MNKQESGRVIAEAILYNASLHGLKAVVAGGYARDTFFGRNPKDVDVVIYDYAAGETDKLEDALVKSGFRYMAEDVEGIASLAGATGVDSVLHLEESGVDVIFIPKGSHRNADNPRDLCRLHDYNINHFYMEHDDKGNLVPVDCRDNKVSLIHSCGAYLPKRAERMKIVAREVGVVVTEDNYSIDNLIPFGG